MSLPDFVFSITLAGRDRLDDLLDAVAAQVFRQVGRSGTEVDQLVTELRAIVSREVDYGAACDVRFLAHDGVCDVVALVGEREIWRTSCPVTV